MNGDAPEYDPAEGWLRFFAWQLQYIRSGVDNPLSQTTMADYERTLRLLAGYCLNRLKELEAAKGSLPS